MTRTCKAIDARLELDFDKNEVRIRREKNRYTKQNKLEDCVFSMADISAIELETPVSGRPGRLAMLWRGSRLYSPTGADQTYLEFYDYPAFYEAVMAVKARSSALVLSNRIGSVAAGVAAPQEAEKREDSLWTENRELLDRLSELRRTLKNRELSVRMERIQSLTGDIVGVVSEKPEQRPQVRRFLGYYLPTAGKLLETYASLEAGGVQTASVVKTKSEIVEAAGMLVTAFEKELDSLFAADALDVATDIRVLGTMLSRDGLADSPFAEKDAGKG